jgi:predicted signal transduction protein with EAL and GGDEF domain
MSKRTMKRPFVWVFPALLLLCAEPRISDCQARDPLVVIASKSNSAAQQLTKAAVKKILLGDMTSWPGGAKVSVILLQPGNPERSLILRTFCGMSESDFTKNRMQLAFTGGTPAAIREVSDVAQVKSTFRLSPGAIAFVHKTDLDETEKVILTVE